MVEMKRMESLEKRFKRDEQFYSQYKCFMDELINKEYARGCDSAGAEERASYVPHQGVLNPTKSKLELYLSAVLSIKVSR